jgi:hypothetical protein
MQFLVLAISFRSGKILVENGGKPNLTRLYNIWAMLEEKKQQAHDRNSF